MRMFWRVTREPRLSELPPIALRPDVPKELKDQVINTIVWKEQQLMIAESVINALLIKGLIIRSIDLQTSLDLLIDDTVLSDIWGALRG